MYPTIKYDTSQEAVNLIEDEVNIRCNTSFIQVSYLPILYVIFYSKAVRGGDQDRQVSKLVEQEKLTEESKYSSRMEHITLPPFGR